MLVRHVAFVWGLKMEPQSHATPPQQWRGDVYYINMSGLQVNCAHITLPSWVCNMP